MSAYSFLVSKQYMNATFHILPEDKEIAAGSYGPPVSWYALFSPENILEVEAPSDEYDEPFTALTLMANKKEAIDRFRKKIPKLKQVAPKGMENFFGRLEIEIENCEGDFIQLIFTDLIEPFQKGDEKILSELITVLDTESIEKWNNLLSYVDCKLDGSINNISYNPETVVNAFVGWVNGEPSPPKFIKKPWWKFW